MAAARHLARAPIVEAVLDVRVAFAVLPAMDALAAVGPRLPGYVEQNRLQSEVQLLFAGPQGNQPLPAPVPAFQSEIGIAYRSADGHYIVQCRRGGLSVSRMHPYEDWAPFFDEMLRAWQAYRQTLHPMRVKRVSTRFINRIEIPVGQDLDDYFTIGPRLPEGAPQFLGQFSTVVGVPFQAEQANAVIRLMMGVPTNAATVGVMLDLDILRDCDLAPDDDVAISEGIHALRPLKNQVFFGSLTEKAMELFQ